MKEKIFEEVREILASLFKMDVAELFMDSSMDSVAPWDSLQHMNVVVDIEQYYNIQLSPEEIVTLKDVAAIVETVQKNIVSVQGG